MSPQCRPHQPQPLRHYVSLTLFQLGNFEQAAEHAYTAASNGPLWDWDELQSLYSQTKVYALRYEELQRLAREANAPVPLHFLLAWHHQMLGHRAEAIAEWQLVLSKLPNDPVATHWLGEAQRPISSPPQPLK
ncbi:MAG: hypothetical protein R3C03_16850 [Pirellulaceae bacterium]